MQTEHNSIFSLIEYFRKGKRHIVNTIPQETYCDEKSHHDFYCDAERPFIQ